MGNIPLATPWNKHCMMRFQSFSKPHPTIGLRNIITYFVLGRCDRWFALQSLYAEWSALHAVAHPVARRNAERHCSAAFYVRQCEYVRVRRQWYLSVHVFRFLEVLKNHVYNFFRNVSLRWMGGGDGRKKLQICLPSFRRSSTYVYVFIWQQVLLDRVRVRRFCPVHGNVGPGHVDHAENRRFRWFCTAKTNA